MELIKGKAKEAFENFYTKGLSTWGKVLNLDLFYSKPDIEKLAYYIDFFDSVGIYFNRGLSFRKSKKYKCEIYTSEEDPILGNCYSFEYKTLSNIELEATTKGIKQANEIFNSKF